MMRGALMGTRAAILSLTVCVCLVTTAPLDGPEQTIENDVNTAVLQRIEQYLHDIKNLLQANGDTSLETENLFKEGSAEDIGAKRNAPSGFFGARGRRGSSSGAGDVKQRLLSPEQKQALNNVVDYIRFLRLQDSGKLQKTKRQPPSGFHGVRGRRSAGVFNLMN